MTQDEIIEMWNSVIKYAPSEVRITEFAKLVAAKVINSTWTKEHWTEYEKTIAAVERETLAQPEQDIAALVTGMEVSIDVSTGDHDSGHRLFGVVDLVQENQGSKHDLILLVQEPKANFKEALANHIEDNLVMVAQPEQEPWCMKMNGCKTKCEDCPVEVAQPEQEPVAWLLTDKNINALQVESIQRLIDRLKYAHHTDLCVRINGQDEWFQADWLKHMVRVTPPQRTWEGLSVFEINDLVESTENEDYQDLVERTEAKLKEKNT